MIERLQYITYETKSLSHIDCVKEACISGVKWIQLRVKNKTQEEYLTIAKEAKIICDLYDVILIINDNVEVAKEVSAHGVHLGKSDVHPIDAREELGKKAIIGGTANTLEGVIALIDHVDYIGLGPFQFTKTKANLSPVLGLQGYDEIINHLKTVCSIKELPIIAIGGIEVEDVEPLLETGVYGIAVSGMINNDFSNTGKVLTKLNNELWPN
jgi:thiamine-phosphate pyrophosphorylase